MTTWRLTAPSRAAPMGGATQRIWNTVWELGWAWTAADIFITATGNVNFAICTKKLVKFY